MTRLGNLHPRLAGREYVGKVGRADAGREDAESPKGARVRVRAEDDLPRSNIALLRYDLVAYPVAEVVEARNPLGAREPPDLRL